MKEFGFYTSKEAFKDGFELLPVKEFVFAHCTIDDIVDELSKNGIEVDVNEVLDEYEKCFHLQKMLDYFYDKNHQKVDALENKRQLFDGDAFYYLMHRLIEEKFDISTLPDPDMIATDIFNEKEIPDKDKPKRFLDLLTRLNKMRNYTDKKNLQDIFNPSLIDIENVIADYSSLTMRKDIINKTMSTKIVKELLNLTEYYELVDNKFCYSVAMDVAGIYGFNSIKNIVDRAINRYPQSEIRFLVNAATSIPEKDREHENLMNRIKGLQPKTDEDYDYLEILSEWFD